MVNSVIKESVSSKAVPNSIVSGKSEPAGVYLTPEGYKSIDPSKISTKPRGIYVGPIGYGNAGTSGGSTATSPGSPVKEELGQKDEARLKKINEQIESEKKNRGGVREALLIERDRLEQKRLQLASGTYGMKDVGAMNKTQSEFIQKYNKYQEQFQTRRIETERPSGITSSLLPQSSSTFAPQKSTISDFAPQGFERIAPQKESTEFVTSINVNTPFQRFFSPIQFKYQEVQQNLRGVTYQYFDDKTLKEISKITAIQTNPILYYSIPQYKELSSGYSYSIYKDIKDYPLKSGIEFGVGYFVGAGLKGAGAGISAFEGTKIGATASKYFNIKQAGEIGITATSLGIAGFYGVQKSGELINAPTLHEKGGVLGLSTKETLLVGFGSYKGMRSFEKGISFFKTIGKTEVPATDIIAKEYYEGQKFPSIKKGQTSGQLLEEFKIPIESLGEESEVSAGFHATTFKFPDITKTKRGKSELFGLNTAPRISPNFLRISGENKKIFSLTEYGSLDINQHRALRIYGKTELLPGLKYSEKDLVRYDKSLRILFGGGQKKRNVFKSREYYGKPKVPRGVQYITFIKPEKEALIPYESTLIKINSNYYFKFQDQRVLIDKFLLIEESGTIPKTKLKFYNAKEIDKYYSNKYTSNYYISPKSFAISRIFSNYKPYYNKSTVKTSYKPYSMKSGANIKSFIKTPRYNPPKYYYPYEEIYNYRLMPPNIPTTNKIPYTKKTSKRKTGTEDIFKRTKRTSIKTKSKDYLLIVEGFISKTLGRTRKIKEKDLLKVASKYQSPFALRERPIIIK